MRFPLILDLAADGIPVAVTCRVLGFSKQAFYRWKAGPVCQRDWDDAHLVNAAYDIHHDDPAFGYRFIADELPAAGISAGRNRVARLCSSQRIWSAFAQKKGLTRKAAPGLRARTVRTGRKGRGEERTPTRVSDLADTVPAGRAEQGEENRGGRCGTAASRGF